MTPFRIFVVEDDPVIQRIIVYAMKLNPEHEVHMFENAKDCLANLHLLPSIISIDYRLPDMNGADLLQQIKKYNEGIRVIVLSGQQDVEIAVNLLKKGANDYITKGACMRECLMNSIQTLKQNILLEREVVELKEEITSHYSKFKDIIGQSEPIKKVTSLIEKAIKTTIPVVILGETGTGKEVVAKSIHYNSDRNKKNFVAVNMTAIPFDLLESELFGYEKGAFTGAVTSKQGKFELADGGTLFLDEIADLDIHLQAKLLRVLQEKELTRLGGTKLIKFDARIIVATHEKLINKVKAGAFRQDLYFRLLGLSIELPPLRERGLDILVLANYFIRNYAKSNQTTPLTLSRKAKDALLNYSFPGNVRELKSMIELASVLADGKLIEKEHLQFQDNFTSLDLFEQEMTIKDYTYKAIQHCLKKYDNNVPIVAQKLGISKSKIYEIIKNND